MNGKKQISRRISNFVDTLPSSISPHLLSVGNTAFPSKSTEWKGVGESERVILKWRNWTNTISLVISLTSIAKSC